MTRPARQSIERESRYAVDTEQLNDNNVGESATHSGHKRRRSKNKKTNNKRTAWKPLDRAVIQEAPKVVWNSSRLPISQQAAAHNVPDIDQSPSAKFPPSRAAAKAPSEPKRKRKNRPPRSEARDHHVLSTMVSTSVPESAYVPPHLRKKIPAKTLSPEYVPPHLRKAASAKPVPEQATGDAAAKPDRATDNTKPQPKPNGQAYPPSPPSTPHEGEKSTSEKPRPWDEGIVVTPKLKPVQVSRRGNSRGRGGFRGRKTVWPKNRDMKPQSHENEDDGGVEYQRSNSNGDPDYDIKKLVDWKGDWLPPPVDAMDRTGFVDRHFRERVARWINGHPQECITELDISSRSYAKSKEIVPKYWAIRTVEHMSISEFWKGLVNRAPDAISDIDVTADPPFWERYEHPRSFFLDALPQPVATLDPKDPDNHAVGIGPVDQILEAKKKERERAQERWRILQRPVRHVKTEVAIAPRVPDNRIVPGLSFYIRPVQDSDVRGLAIICNYYIENSLHAKDMKPTTEKELLPWVNQVKSKGLPFLVAVSKTVKPKVEDGVSRELIIGFVMLEDYYAPGSAYRYTFDMKLYDHPGYFDRKIAQCLLDKLLELADPSYIARGGYEYRNDSDYLKVGHIQVIKTIYLSVHLEHGENDDLLTEKLKKYNFEKSGHFKKVGFKFGKFMDSFSYLYHTSEQIH